jgi:acyl dehydratase
MLLPLTLNYRRRPSAVAFMARAFWPTALRRRGPFPPVAVHWRGHRVQPWHLESFQDLTGLGAPETLSLLYPQVLGYPLQMVALTHPALPLPIWKVLQIRAHIVQHHPLAPGESMDLACRVAGQRVLEKGMEVDLGLTVSVGGEARWESLNTYYYRGRFGTPGAPSPLAKAPETDGAVSAQWLAARRTGWGYGRLSGDYNGIHWMDAYARRFGFRGAFYHPPVMVAQAAARLPEFRTATAGKLDAWFKGPVYYGSTVRLHVSRAGAAHVFALRAGDETRPSIVGKWQAGAVE